MWIRSNATAVLGDKPTWPTHEYTKHVRACVCVHRQPLTVWQPSQFPMVMGGTPVYGCRDSVRPIADHLPSTPWQEFTGCSSADLFGTSKLQIFLKCHLYHSTDVFLDHWTCVKLWYSFYSVPIIANMLVMKGSSVVPLSLFFSHKSCDFKCTIWHSMWFLGTQILHYSRTDWTMITLILQVVKLRSEEAKGFVQTHMAWDCISNPDFSDAVA